MTNPKTKLSKDDWNNATKFTNTTTLQGSKNKYSFNEQLSRGHSIVADGWAGAYNS